MEKAAQKHRTPVAQTEELAKRGALAAEQIQFNEPTIPRNDTYRTAHGHGRYHLNGTPYHVEGTQVSLWSNLGMLLAEHNMSVLALHKRLQEKGVSVNLKSLYRLAALNHSRSSMLGL